MAQITPPPQTNRTLARIPPIPVCVVAVPVGEEVVRLDRPRRAFGVLRRGVERRVRVPAEKAKRRRRSSEKKMHVDDCNLLRVRFAEGARDSRFKGLKGGTLSDVKTLACTPHARRHRTHAHEVELVALLRVDVVDDLVEVRELLHGALVPGRAGRRGRATQAARVKKTKQLSFGMQHEVSNTATWARGTTSRAYLMVRC